MQLICAGPVDFVSARDPDQVSIEEKTWEGRWGFYVDGGWTRLKGARDGMAGWEGVGLVGWEWVIR